MYDAIVVGARCAGAPTAMLLARRGRRVLLVDRAAFPSDVLSAHAIQAGGVAALRRWGLLDRLVATGTPPVVAMSFDTGPVRLHGTPVPVEGIGTMFAPRRTVLDTLLVQAAEEGGVEVRERFTVKELVFEDGRVVGIRGRDAAGRAVEERAAVVVGADGVHSMVARHVGASTYRVQRPATVAAYGYWSGVDLAGTAELYVRPGRFVVAVPTNDDLVVVAQEAPVAEERAYRRDVERAFLDTLALVPALAGRLAGGTRVERFRFTTDTGGFFRTPHGPGWALVGDAGYHKDPITAQGMLDAFLDAERLAVAIDRGLADRDLDGALRRAHRARDASVSEMYDHTCGLTHLDAPPPPEVTALLAALEGNQAQIDRFFGIMAGSVGVGEFFSPANVTTILGAAAA